MDKDRSKDKENIQAGNEETQLSEENLALTEPVIINTMPRSNGNGNGKVHISPETAEAISDHDKKGKVAILSEDGFEEVELTVPKHALEEAGFDVEVISPHDGNIKGWNKTDWGKEVPVDRILHDARPYEYDAVVLPGGVMNPDKLRQNKEAIVFLKQFIVTGKPVAAICHGAQTLIETGMLEGRTMTSFPSLKTDLRNAGVKWVDKEMVHSGQFITSRRPADLNSFNKELIYALTLQEH